MKDDAPAFLTITSLQLPDSPIPLIDSQAVARSCRSSRGSDCGSSSSSSRNDHDHDKDAIMDELLRKVVAVRGQAEGLRSKRNKGNNSKCNRQFNDLEECTRRIIEGPGYARKRTSRSGKAGTNDSEAEDCICSEVSENLRINIRRKTEVRRTSRSPSPEVTHIIRIAMKYHGQQQDDPCVDGIVQEELQDSKPLNLPEDEKKDADRGIDDQKRCPGVSVALDFTLNCSSLQLTARDVSVRMNKGKDQLQSSSVGD